MQCLSQFLITVIVDPERYTAVPIHAKIISLLVEEFASASASEQQANEETESVYDDVSERRASLLST